LGIDAMAEVIGMVDAVNCIAGFSIAKPPYGKWEFTLGETVTVDDASRTQAEKIARIRATGGLRSRIRRTLL
jgi:hypothetical protein